MKNYIVKLKLGLLFCKIGLHWWKYDCYRDCRRCHKKQMLVETITGIHWEDCYQPNLNENSNN